MIDRAPTVKQTKKAEGSLDQPRTQTVKEKNAVSKVGLQSFLRESSSLVYTAGVCTSSDCGGEREEVVTAW